MLNCIEDINRRLIERYDPESVVLFGSHARNMADSNSDVDLLVIKRTHKRPIDRRIEVELLLADRNVAVDVLVYTPAEMNRLHSLGSHSDR